MDSSRDVRPEALGVVAAGVQCGGDEVDRVDTPPELGEPERVSAC